MMEVTSEIFRGAVDKFYEDRKLQKLLSQSATVCKKTNRNEYNTIPYNTTQYNTNTNIFISLFSFFLKKKKLGCYR